MDAGPVAVRSNKCSLVADEPWTLDSFGERMIRLHQVYEDPAAAPEEADTMWVNHVSGVHWPNFGTTGWSAVASGAAWTSTWIGGRQAFTCNPQSGAVGKVDTSWAVVVGTRFVRYWLK